MIRLVVFLIFLIALWRVVRPFIIAVLAQSGGTTARTTAGRERPWDPWAVLGVPRGAPRDVIAQAYREQVKRYHPDRVADLGPELQRVAHEKTLELQRAYAELTG